MNNGIIRYIKSCPICQQDKPNNQKLSGLLQPIQSPSIRWHTINIDFIVQLPMTKLKHDAILAVVDKFTKMSHFIPTTTKVTAPETAKLIFDNIIRLHGLPSVIISDRDSRFTSNFWKSLFELLNTKLSMSTAFHPQSNGQTEIINRYLEQALRHYTDIIQNDWDTYLTHIEIAHNNSVNTTTKYTPFYLNYGFNPTFPSNLLNSVKQSNVETVKQVLLKLDKITKLAANNIIAAQQRQKYYTDNSRREVEFKIGDNVLLSTKNLKTLLPEQTKKLSKNFIGPFKIIEVISKVAYKLELPSHMRVHNVFHISLLKEYIIDKMFTNRNDSRPDPEYNEKGEAEWEVERILNKRKIGKGYQYLVKWKNYPAYEATWEPSKNLKGSAEELIKEFDKSQQ